MLATALLLVGLIALIRIGYDAPVRATANVLDAELARAGTPAEVAQFYQGRANRPFWIRSAGVPPFWTRGELRPEAAQMAAIARDALPAEVPAAARARAAAALAAARSGRPEDLARAEVALSVALAEAIRSMQPGASGAALVFTDPDLPARPAPAEALEQAAASGNLAGYLKGVAEVNPVYAALRRQYSATDPQARLIEANLQRLRVLPPLTARRFILVNPAAAELALYEDGRVKDTMRVVVGRRDEQTPMMAGLMTHLVLNPYWEVPVDLVQDSLAPKVIRNGAAWFTAQHFQALSDWGDDPVPLDPATVDWPSVAGGGVELPVRQLPGGDNMMGGVKFMLPNELGIYLHDTPDRWAFDAKERLISAGCVRVERARDLMAWLFEGKPPAAAKPNTRADLVEGVPVYITYLTAAPGAKGVVFHPDVYGRDPAQLAALSRAR